MRTCLSSCLLIQPRQSREFVIPHAFQWLFGQWVSYANARTRIILSKNVPAKRQNPKEESHAELESIVISCHFGINHLFKVKKRLSKLSHNPSSLIPFPDRQI